MVSINLFNLPFINLIGQAPSAEEMFGWIVNLHLACAACLARNLNRENVCRLLKNEIHKLENSIDLVMLMWHSMITIITFLSLFYYSLIYFNTMTSSSSSSSSSSSASSSRSSSTTGSKDEEDGRDAGEPGERRVHEAGLGSTDECLG